MRSIGLLSWFTVAIKDFVLQIAQPDNVKEQPPPIRYYGDPTEIYLA